MLEGSENQYISDLFVYELININKNKLKFVFKFLFYYVNTWTRQARQGLFHTGLRYSLHKLRSQNQEWTSLRPDWARSQSGCEHYPRKDISHRLQRQFCSVGPVNSEEHWFSSYWRASSDCWKLRQPSSDSIFGEWQLIIQSACRPPFINFGDPQSFIDGQWWKTKGECDLQLWNNPWEGTGGYPIWSR